MMDAMQLAAMAAAGGVGGLIYWTISQRRVVLARAKRVMNRR